MKYQFKGTPGPWNVGFGGGLTGDVISWSVFLDGEECVQLPIRSGDEAVCLIPHGRDYQKHEADAQAIAALPELIEAGSAALESLLFSRQELRAQASIPDADEQQIQNAIDMLRITLTKATGEDQ